MGVGRAADTEWGVLKLVVPWTKRLGPTRELQRVKTKTQKKTPVQSLQIELLLGLRNASVRLRISSARCRSAAYRHRKVDTASIGVIRWRSTQNIQPRPHSHLRHAAGCARRFEGGGGDVFAGTRRQEEGAWTRSHIDPRHGPQLGQPLP